MPSTQEFKTEQEVDEAYSEALRGGAVGAAKWGLVAAVAASTAYAISPVYRGLTPQFKVYVSTKIDMCLVIELRLIAQIFAIVVDDAWRSDRRWYV